MEPRCGQPAPGHSIDESREVENLMTPFLNIHVDVTRVEGSPPPPPLGGRSASTEVDRHQEDFSSFGKHNTRGGHIVRWRR